ncbi:MAG: HlyD family efflux transporter periplasmic adaptor subunit [Rhodobacteraceae bacterium]|jgi:HlyD family secretion protein|nr:HlyD family efflux transporter periplasmic adaptor subunit [Paracoccaceae bacterium]
MKLNPRTIIMGLILAGIVAALLVVTFRTEPIPVDLADVTRAPMRITVNADGRTRIREIYEVASPVAGTARRSPVAVGDPVVAGETVVAVVEPVAPALLDARTRAQAEAALREAEAAVAVAEAQEHQAGEDLAYSRSQFERARTLVERGVASVTRLEDASQALASHEAALATARSQLSAARSSRDRAAAALVEPGTGSDGDGGCCVALTAPVDGVVLDIGQISERPVSMGTPLVSVGDPADIEIVADLLSADAVRLAPGALAEVDRWGGPAPLQARLRAIDPVARTKVSALGIEEQRVDAVFDLLSPPEARPGLGGGFAVFLRVVEWETGSALQLPLSALFRQGDGWAVFAVSGGTARRVPVEIGRRNGETAEVLSGLEEGDRVVTHPNDALSDGAPVVERVAF